jgi:hypothetical protein
MRDGPGAGAEWRRGVWAAAEFPEQDRGVGHGARVGGFDARPLLPAAPTAIDFETPHPTDDLFLTEGGTKPDRAYIQAKRGLRFSSQYDSELAAVIEQFVDQYAAAHADASGDASSSAPHRREAIILATDLSSSSRVRNELRTVLPRCGDMSEEPVEARVARNSDEAGIFRDLRQHLARAW